MRLDRLDRVKLLILVDGIREHSYSMLYNCRPHGWHWQGCLLASDSYLLVLGSSQVSSCYWRSAPRSQGVELSIPFPFPFFLWFSCGQLLLSLSSRKHHDASIRRRGLAGARIRHHPSFLDLSAPQTSSAHSPPPSGRTTVGILVPCLCSKHLNKGAIRAARFQCGRWWSLFGRPVSRPRRGSKVWSD